MERAWLREFNSVGLQLRPQAAKLVTSFLRECENPQQMAETLVEHTKTYFHSRQGTVDAFITAEVVQDVITCMSEAKENSGDHDVAEVAMHHVQSLDIGDGVEVYSALRDVDSFDYKRATKEWSTTGKKPILFPGANTRSQIYADRYHILWQRLLLEGELVPEALSAESGVLEGQRVLTPVESLVGNPGRKLTFGLLSREHDNSGIRRWAIEDIHRTYPVELMVEESEHLFTDGSFVLAEGELIGDVFRIFHLDGPAAVKRETTKEKDDVPVGVFGGALTKQQIDIRAQAEDQYQDGMYVVLSEVHLDSSRTLERLSDLFQGYESVVPPVAYVFMGSFCSSSFLPTQAGVQKYRDSFERLKFMMRSLPKHIERGTRFIFVPGPNDPGAASLPRAGLADYLTSDIAKEIPNVIMGTNPCRIRHFSRELVFFRHNVLRLLRRHEVVPLKGPGNVPPSPQHVREEMVQFLFDQAHLVPLPLDESNILMDFDHTLRLYPLPDAVFVGGDSQNFEYEYQGCRFCSVGPFHSDASFYGYYPIQGLLEPCSVPDVAG